ncbi:sn-glycerol-3-phosphate ABC transporter permease UgpE [Rhodovibrio salinarum]|uniref:sn-glycerol-3-phosphate transport system permease protein UgpE n=1 Tax=Rhodovibrio salinarum TaxID=1087 RepID=A0A934QEJ8_9PROT|nr:sn-glycerol-3-phosphate ABC transporter permease UgpE [Rhodovibrio salinarum]MBK1695721.1 sn-glycerol-3-phosphate ABC transporter permease UgpE [Rhodovibrio salinarum]
MIERRRGLTIFSHAVLWGGILTVILPVYLAFVASTHPLEDVLSAPIPVLPGDQLIENYTAVLTGSVANFGSAPVLLLLANSLVMALGISIGKIAISVISAYAIVYFRFPLRPLFFWLIFVTLMLPVEVRIIPTYEVAANLSLLNSYQGLILPLIASATATFLFRQFFLTIPDQMLEAARIDGAGPIRFFIDIVLPLSRTNIAALFVILFIYGWNQYLWPLLITTDQDMGTIVVGISNLVQVTEAEPRWPYVMATTVLALIPPVVVIVLMQRQFVRGLVEQEK